MATSTAHMITTFRFLNPEVTEWALLKVSPFDKLEKRSVFWRVSVQLSVLFAAQPFVPLHSAQDAVGLFAEPTIEPLVFFVSIPLEDELAVGSWTVIEQLVVLLDKHFELKLL